MNLREKVTKAAHFLVGVNREDDQREPAIVFMPEACRCPVDDCGDRGKYTNCYFNETAPKCRLYQEYGVVKHE